MIGSGKKKYQIRICYQIRRQSIPSFWRNDDAPRGARRVECLTPVNFEGAGGCTSLTNELQTAGAAQVFHGLRWRNTLSRKSQEVAQWAYEGLCSLY
jgi:hypothetical protein